MLTPTRDRQSSNEAWQTSTPACRPSSWSHRTSLPAGPRAPVAVFLPTDYAFLESLAVPGDADDRVFVSLVVPVAARRDVDHMLPPLGSENRFIYVIEGSSTVAIETQTK